jgi:hypothetical protein
MTGLVSALLGWSLGYEGFDPQPKIPHDHHRRIKAPSNDEFTTETSFDSCNSGPGPMIVASRVHYPRPTDSRGRTTENMF